MAQHIATHQPVNCKWKVWTLVSRAKVGLVISLLIHCILSVQSFPTTPTAEVTSQALETTQGLPNQLNASENEIFMVPDRFSDVNNFKEHKYTISPPGINSADMYGDETCPGNNTVMPETGPLKERSSCPWVLKWNHDPKRYPKDIPEAVCKCNRTEGCVGRPKGTYRCERVITDMSVLWRVESKFGMWRYEPKVIPIATSCVCAKGDSQPSP